MSPTIRSVAAALAGAGLWFGASACVKTKPRDAGENATRTASIELVKDGTGGEPVRFGFRHATGDRRVYRVKARQTIDLPAIYDAGVDRSVIEHVSRQTERVVATRDAGADVETTFSDVKLTITGPLAGISSELERATASYRVETRVSPNGVVRGLKADPGASPLLKTWVGSTSRQLASGPAVFPDEPVAVGGVWRRVEPISEGARGTSDPAWNGDLATEYLLERVDGTLATIRSTTKLAMRGVVPKHGTRIDVETTGGGKGEMTFDIAKGIVVRSRLDFVTETRTTGREIPRVAPTKVEGWTEVELEKP